MMLNTIRPQSPFQIGSIEIDSQDSHGLFLKAVFIDGEGRRWGSRIRVLNPFMRCIGSYYIGCRDNVSSPQIIGGPFGEVPGLLGEHFLFTIGEQGEWIRVDAKGVPTPSATPAAVKMPTTGKANPV